MTPTQITLKQASKNNYQSKYLNMQTNCGSSTDSNTSPDWLNKPTNFALQSGISHPGIAQIDTNGKKSGFFDLPKNTRCTHREHNPPGHICIPQEKGYRHVCPACGAESILTPPQISL